MTAVALHSIIPAHLTPEKIGITTEFAAALSCEGYNVHAPNLRNVFENTERWDDPVKPTSGWLRMVREEIDPAGLLVVMNPDDEPIPVGGIPIGFIRNSLGPLALEVATAAAKDLKAAKAKDPAYDGGGIILSHEVPTAEGHVGVAGGNRLRKMIKLGALPFHNDMDKLREYLRSRTKEAAEATSATKEGEQ